MTRRRQLVRFRPPTTPPAQQAETLTESEVWVLLSLHYAETVTYGGLHRALTPLNDKTSGLLAQELLQNVPYPATHLMLSPAGVA